MPNMRPDVQFGASASGIPYVMEFANVSFAPKRPPHLSLPHSSRAPRSRAAALADLVRVPSARRRKQSPPVLDGTPASRGLYIRFADGPAQPLSETRLYKLKRNIARAVTAAGMASSPTQEKASSAGESAPGTLFSGTYGQLMNAFDSVGLTSTPCLEAGVTEATRVGMLVVANRSEGGEVVFTNLTLWA